MRSNRLWLLSVFALAGVLLAGCAYTTKSGMSADIKKIEVHTFGNETFYNNMEGYLTTQVIERVNLSPGLKAVNNGGDAVLTGRIYKVRNINTELDSNGQPRTVQVTVSAKFSLYNVKTQQYIFEDMDVINTQDSDSAGRMRPDKGDDWAAARESAMDEVAKLLVRRMVSNW